MLFRSKKLCMLGGLGVLGVVVLAWTFLGGKTPATAQAGMAVAGGPVVDLEGALREMQSPAKATGNKSFVTVDEALEVFLTGWKAQLIPVDQVRLNAFDLRSTVLAQAVSAQTKAAEAAAAAKQAAVSGPAKDDPLITQLRKMRLETVMVSSRNSAAIINGRVVGVGESVDGFVIAQIEPNRVVMQCDGRAFALTLR